MAEEDFDSEEDFDGGVEDTSMEAVDVRNGVTLFWLTQVFGGHRQTVIKKLAGCPVVGRARGKGKPRLYDLATAASYLIPPASRDIERYIRENPGSLPERLNKDYWDAKLKEQKWLENAADLWRTEDIFEVFSETFKTIRDSLRMVPDSVEIAESLSPVQRKTLEAALDGVQADIQQRFNEASDDNLNLAQLEEQAYPLDLEDVV
jgi:phage terminase Nu1 subunit (DNA packaging protein)